MAAEDMLDGDDPLGGCRGMMLAAAITAAAIIVALIVVAWP